MKNLIEIHHPSGNSSTPLFTEYAVAAIEINKGGDVHFEIIQDYSWASRNSFRIEIPNTITDHGIRELIKNFQEELQEIYDIEIEGAEGSSHDVVEMIQDFAEQEILNALQCDATEWYSHVTLDPSHLVSALCDPSGYATRDYGSPVVLTGKQEWLDSKS